MDPRRRKWSVEERGKKKEVRELKTVSNHLRFKLHLLAGDQNNICKYVKSVTQKEKPPQ